MKALTMLNDVVSKVIKVILIILFAAITIVIFMQIVYRYVLLKPIPWAEEVARYLFVWISFLGAGVAVKNKSHVGVEFVINLLPKKTTKMALTFAYLLCAGFTLLMAYHGWTLVLRTAGQVSAAMRMPMSYAYLAIPVGFIVMTKNFIIIACQEVASIRKDSETDKIVDLRGE